MENGGSVGGRDGAFGYDFAAREGPTHRLQLDSFAYTHANTDTFVFNSM